MNESLWTISRSNRCLSLREVFNESFAKMNLLRRIKYYHTPCRNQTDRLCFYDESHLCICDQESSQVNCLEFDHNVKYNCGGRKICENGGKCFFEDSKCPVVDTCVCDDCSYGSRCQFLRMKFDLSLDTIFGKHIRPHLPTSQQRTVFKIIIGVVILMVLCDS